MKLKMTTRMPINTNANNKISRAARTSSLVRQSKKAARKSTLGNICNKFDEKLHGLHEGRGCFKPVKLTKIVEDLKGEFPWIHFMIAVEVLGCRVHGRCSGIGLALVGLGGR